MSIKTIATIILAPLLLYFLYKTGKFFYYQERTDDLLGKRIDINKHIVIKLDKDIHSYLIAKLDLNLLPSAKSYSDFPHNTEAYEYEEIANKLFPPKSIRVCLYHSDNENIKVCDYHEGINSFGKDYLGSLFYFDAKPHTAFNRIEIETKRPIKNATISWANWMM